MALRVPPAVLLALAFALGVALERCLVCGPTPADFPLPPDFPAEPIDD